MIAKGTNEIGAIYKGSTELSVVYRGETEVWSGGKVISLGTGTSFNIGTLCPTISLESIDADDFYISPNVSSGSGVAYATGHCQAWDSTGSRESAHCTSGGSASCSISFTKSYDSTTGIFSCNYGGYSVKAYLIPKATKMIESGKMINLGSGGSFDLTNYPTGITINNFVYKTIPSTYDSMNYCYSTSCPVGVYWYKYISSSTLVSKLGRTRLGDVATNPYYIPSEFLE